MPIVKNLTDEELVTQVANDRTVTVPSDSEVEVSVKDALSLKTCHGEKVEVIEDEAESAPAPKGKGKGKGKTKDEPKMTELNPDEPEGDEDESEE